MNSLMLLILYMDQLWPRLWRKHGLEKWPREAFEHDHAVASTLARDIRSRLWETAREDYAQREADLLATCATLSELAIRREATRKHATNARHTNEGKRRRTGRRSGGKNKRRRDAAEYDSEYDEIDEGAENDMSEDEPSPVHAVKDVE